MTQENWSVNLKKAAKIFSAIPIEHSKEEAYPPGFLVAAQQFLPTLTDADLVELCSEMKKEHEAITEVSMTLWLFYNSPLTIDASRLAGNEPRIHGDFTKIA